MKIRIKTLLAALGLLVGLSAAPVVAGQTYTVLKHFTGSDGAEPYTGLTLSDSTLYGATANGGSSGSGMVFKINTDGSGFTILRDLTGGIGRWPHGDLTLSDATLYGTTSHGGNLDRGTIFKLNTNGASLIIFKTFNGIDGAYPFGDLTLSGNALYGTTSGNGADNYGTVFKVNTDGSGFTVLKNFTGADAGNDGANPHAGLTLSGSTLYGTTEGGGSSYNGTVFKINTDGSGFTVLKSFSDSEGRLPLARLVLSGNTLYGTTSYGGSSNYGTVFRINTNGSSFTVIKDFAGSDGANPYAGLTLSGSTLYGTTLQGGQYGYGTVFKVSTDGSVFAVVKNFAYSDGGAPNANLTLSANTLYSTTRIGGIFGSGTAFALRLSAFLFGINWNTNSCCEINFTYQIDDELQAPAIAHLFWAKGTNLSDILSTNPIVSYSVPATNHYTNTVQLSLCESLSNMPPASTHLLMTVDSTNLFLDIASGTPVAALPLPPADTNSYQLKWNTYYNYGLYFITNETTPDVLRLYWASGPEIANILSPQPILTYPIGSPTITNTFGAVLLPNTDLIVGGGVLTNAPSGSTHIIMVASQTNQPCDLLARSFHALQLPRIGLTGWRVPENWKGQFGNVWEIIDSNGTNLINTNTLNGDLKNFFEFYPAVVSSGADVFRTFSFNSVSNLVEFDYETTNTHILHVHTDAFGGLDGAFPIEVFDTNDPPMGVIFSTNQFARGRPIGTVVGTFSPIDQDASGSHPDFHDHWTYSLVAGIGSDDNHLFEIPAGSSNLVTQSTFTGITKTNFSIRVRVDDSETFTNQVISIFTSPLEAQESPSIIDQPQNLTVTNGSNASFSVTASGTTPLYYQWRFNGTILSGQTQSNLTLAAVTPTQAGPYSVVITNTAGSVTSSVAIMTVLVPPMIVTQPSSQTVTNGGNATFSVTASGTTPLSYQWRFNGTNLIGQTQSNLVLTAVTSNQTGPYTVVLTNSAGSLTSSVATLTVPPSFIPSSAIHYYPFDGSNVMDVIGSADGTLMSGAFVSNGVLNLDGFNDFVSFTQPLIQGGTFSIAFFARQASLQSGYAEMISQHPFYVGHDPSRIIRVGDAWISTGVPMPSDGQVHHYAVTAGSQMKLYIDGVLRATLGNPSSTPGAATIFGNQAGGYTEFFNGTLDEVFIYTNILSAAEIALLATQNSSPPSISSQPQSATVTNGGNASFTVTTSGTPSLSYQWRFNGTNLIGQTQSNLVLTAVAPNQAGPYTVVITNTAGSLTSSVATLTVLLPPAIASQPQDVTVTNGGTATFSVVASGTTPLSYQWRFNGTNLIGQTHSNLVLTAVTSNQAGPYAVVITNSAGSLTSSVAILTVLLPPAIVSQPQDVTVTNGGSATFSVGASGTTPLFYQWRFNGTNLIGQTQSNLVFTAATSNQAGPYTVVLTNSAGSLTSSVALLTIFSPSVPLLLIRAGDVLSIDASTGDFIGYRPSATNFYGITNVGSLYNCIALGEGSFVGTAWIASDTLGKIIKVNLADGSFTNFAIGIPRCFSVVYHDQRIYATSADHSSIYVFDAATGSITNQWNSNLASGYTGMTWDAGQNRFLVSSYYNGRIDALSTNGDFTQILAGGAVGNPYHITYESPGQFLLGYDDSTVRRLTLGDSNVVTLVTNGLGLPLVAVPDRNGKLYVGNAAGGATLRRMNANGTGLESLGDPGQPGGSLYHVVMVNAENIPNGSALQNPVLVSPTSFQFTLAGSAGTYFLLQSSTNLTAWESVELITIPPSGTTNIPKIIAPGDSKRFYRAIPQ